MRDFIKPIFFIALISLVAASQASGQSNFEYFFKTEAQYQDVVVDEVVSADTLLLESKSNEKREKIKLIGLKAPSAPERKEVDIERDKYGFRVEKEASPLTPVEEKAFEFVKELLAGKHIRLEFDHNKNSDQFATLAYVFLLDENTFVNAEILRQGFADLQIRPPNTKYEKELRDAYMEARTEKRGLQGE